MVCKSWIILYNKIIGWRFIWTYSARDYETGKMINWKSGVWARDPPSPSLSCPTGNYIRLNISVESRTRVRLIRNIPETLQSLTEGLICLFEKYAVLKQSQQFLSTKFLRLTS